MFIHVLLAFVCLACYLSIFLLFCFFVLIVGESICMEKLDSMEDYCNNYILNNRLIAINGNKNIDWEESSIFRMIAPV